MKSYPLIAESLTRMRALPRLHAPHAWLVGAVSIASLTMTGGTYAAGTSAAASDGLEEIVVTAQRREETLQKIAIPVTALTSDDLENAGITAAADLTRMVPSVAVYSGGQGSVQASLRGVGNLAGNTYAEQAIAFSLDGAYIARGEAIGGNFFDLDRVEILKGPQGTLYGRNTNAGAINLITKKPQIGTLSINLGLDIGNYGKYAVDGATNLPVSDNSALRLSGQRVSHRGYFSDGYNDQDESDARGIWLWKPSEDLKFWISADYSHVGGMGSAGALVPKTGDFWDGPSTPGQAARWTAAGALPVATDGFLNIDNRGFTAQLDWTTAAGTLTAIPSYRNSDENARHYAAGFAVDFNQTSETKSMEVRFATPSNNRVNGIIGVYWFKEDAGFDLTAHQYGPGGAADPTSFRANNIIPNIQTESKALFGQGTFKFTDTLRLVAGARYTKEDKSTSGVTKATSVANFATSSFASLNNSLNASKTTGKLGLEWDVAPDSLVYVTASTGFKAGGFFAVQGGTFKPETLTAFTLGSKNRFLNNSLQFNIEAYHWKYKDKQVSHLGPLPNGSVDLVTDNAGNATLYGIEPEVVWLATSKDRISAAIQYEHAVYDEFKYQTLNPITGATATGCPAPAVASNGPPLVEVNCSGYDVPNTPTWSGTVSYNRTFDLSNGGTLVGDISAHYRGETVSGEEQLAAEHNDAYTTEDFTLTYKHPGNRWTLAGYVYNLSDTESTSSSFFYGAPPTRPTPLGAITLQNPPRTYGARINLSF